MDQRVFERRYTSAAGYDFLYRVYITSVAEEWVASVRQMRGTIEETVAEELGGIRFNDPEEAVAFVNRYLDHRHGGRRGEG